MSGMKQAFAELTDLQVTHPLLERGADFLVLLGFSIVEQIRAVKILDAEVSIGAMPYIYI